MDLKKLVKRKDDLSKICPTMFKQLQAVNGTSFLSNLAHIGGLDKTVLNLIDKFRLTLRKLRPTISNDGNLEVWSIGNEKAFFTKVKDGFNIVGFQGAVAESKECDEDGEYKSENNDKENEKGEDDSGTGKDGEKVEEAILPALFKTTGAITKKCPQIWKRLTETGVAKLLNARGSVDSCIDKDKTIKFLNRLILDGIKIEKVSNTTLMGKLGQEVIYLTELETCPRIMGFSHTSGVSESVDENKESIKAKIAELLA